ncbi:hypothetical protein HOA93_01180 [bacterium]|nr:hypothetical protein [bacterium]
MNINIHPTNITKSHRAIYKKYVPFILSVHTLGTSLKVSTFLIASHHLPILRSSTHILGVSSAIDEDSTVNLTSSSTFLDAILAT